MLEKCFFTSWIIFAKNIVLLTFQPFLVVHGASWSQEILFHKTDAFFADAYKSILSRLLFTALLIFILLQKTICLHLFQYYTSQFMLI